MKGYEAYLVDLDGTLYEALPVKLAMAGELAVAGWLSWATLRRFRQEHERLRELQAQPEDSPFRLQIESTARALGVPSGDVERCVQFAMQGVRLSYAPQLPAAVAALPGACYFALDNTGALYEQMIKAESISVYVPAGIDGLRLELIVVTP